MDDNAWRTSRPDLITQATLQRAAERVVKDSWRDWVPVVNVSSIRRTSRRPACFSRRTPGG
jgi:hypothetical protein